MSFTPSLKKSLFLDYTKSAETGDPVAQSLVGWCWRLGFGTEKNLAEAFKWHLKAAEACDKPNPVAQRHVGYCFDMGEGIERDYAMAIKWYLKAIENGDMTSLINLGICYLYGRGVKKE